MQDPFGGFSQRPAFSSLPAATLERLELHEGSELDNPQLSVGGYTLGIASVLKRRSDGRNVFVKAIAATNEMADAYRAEARIVPLLPDAINAPKLRFSFEADGWVVLCFDAVNGSCPPPRSAEGLDAVLALLVSNSNALTPNPIEGLPSISDELTTTFDVWTTPKHLEIADLNQANKERLTELSAGWMDATRGETALHLDVRSDNVLIDEAGSAWLVDWSSLAVGAAWVDLVVYLASVDTAPSERDDIVRTHRVSGPVANADIDALLAALAGYWLWQAGQPEVEHTTGLRVHQRLAGQTCLAWLRYRGHDV